MSSRLRHATYPVSRPLTGEKINSFPATVVDISSYHLVKLQLFIQYPDSIVSCFLDNTDSFVSGSYPQS